MPPETLYHYTDASGLLGIVESATLWATDVRFLNDTQDATYARADVIRAISDFPNPMGDPSTEGTPPLESLLERGPADEWETARRLTVAFVDYDRVSMYVSCFCESDDLLSQWRGYGSDHGYAVGFDASALEGAVAELPRSSLSQVRYGLDGADDVIAQAVARVAHGSGHPSVAAYYRAMEIRTIVASVKHPSFAEEREWRVIVSMEDDVTTLFRATNRAIIPYVKVSLPLDALVSVRVGPGNNTGVRKEGVSRLLRRVGSAASVVVSEIPLRS